MTKYQGCLLICKTFTRRWNIPNLRYIYAIQYSVVLYYGVLTFYTGWHHILFMYSFVHMVKQRAIVDKYLSEDVLKSMVAVGSQGKHIFAWRINIILSWLLMTYCHTHRLMHLSSDKHLFSEDDGWQLPKVKEINDRRIFDPKCTIYVPLSKIQRSS